MSKLASTSIQQILIIITSYLLLSSAAVRASPNILRRPIPQNDIPNKELHPYNLHPSAGNLSQPYLYPQSEVVKMSEEERRDLSWGLQVHYAGTTFFDGWQFFTQSGGFDSVFWGYFDPSHGLVNYVDSATAFSTGLAFWTSSSQPGIQVEHWSNLSVNTPRNSVRISTKALFAGGMFIIDMAIMPWGCGVWPAFWTLGYAGTWPETGEIDIIEGIMSGSHNQMTVHTTPGCTINHTAGLYTGTLGNPICDSSSGGSGCGIISDSATSYGNDFNNVGGGVFAMQWDGSGIKFWNWNRANIPADLTANNPSPAAWGLPVAAFDASTCDPGRFFQAQQLILNIDLCGDWAGNLYSQFSYCPGTCAEFISKGSNLNNAVMIINHIQVYQQSGSSPIGSQAATNSNQTGAGGNVGRSSGGTNLRTGSVEIVLGVIVALLVELIL